MSSDQPPPRTWFVLHHTAGPAVEVDGFVFEHPGIGEHFAFLQRRLAAGELVAAGPLPTDRNEGMTILDVASLEEAQRLATEDDVAVASGVLAVTVRPWQVVMTR